MKTINSCKLKCHKFIFSNLLASERFFKMLNCLIDFRFGMKLLFSFILMLFTNSTISQKRMAELMLRTSGYNGDLTQSTLSAKRIGACGSFNVTHQSGSHWSIRTGISYGRISGDDNYNKEKNFKSRKLSSKSHLIEWNNCGELSVVDSEMYYSYPYFFGGVGLMYFNPYVFNNKNKKLFLRPMSPEGQGLVVYPDREIYSLYQVCIPFGLGWRVKLKNKWEISYEFRCRMIFTDYLDDVSTTYVSLKNLSELVSADAAAISYPKQSLFME
jgi:hypothetical protein